MSNDGRDALRRYLEQRRDLGETELVLDGMSVDDVLRVVGAQAGARRTAARREEVAAPADHPRLHEDAPGPAEDARDVDTPAVGDWRAMLRASGAEPPPPRGVSTPPEAAPPRRSTHTGDGDSPAPGAAAAPTGDPADAPPAGRAGGAARWRIEGIDVPTGLVVGGDAGELFGGPTEGLQSLDDVAAAVAKCTRCPLHRTAKNPVPGEGNPNAQLVVAGEAPGANEDATGRPFVGEAGQLLTKILAAISLRREDVFICNVLKHRPPGNRNPEPDEVEACSPYLVRQLELIRPKAILTVGNFAAQTLLGTKLGISKLRGQVHRYHGIPLVATYHPAALLRNPTWKRPTWEDVQLVRRLLDRA